MAIPKARNKRDGKIPNPELFQRHILGVQAIVPRADLVHAKRMLVRNGMSADDYRHIIKSVITAVKLERARSGKAGSAKMAAVQILRPLLHHEVEAVQTRAKNAIEEIRAIKSN